MRINNRFWWQGVHRLIGIEVQEWGDELYIRTSIISVSSEKVFTSESNEFYAWDDLTKYLEKEAKALIILNLFGNFVIEKRVDDFKSNTADILGMGVDRQDDFILEFHSATEQKPIGALIRKETFQEKIDLLGKAQERIISISISPAIISYLLPQLNSPEDSDVHINAKNQVYSFINGNFDGLGQIPKEDSLDVFYLANQVNLNPDDLYLISHVIKLFYFPDHLLINGWLELQRKNRFREKVMSKALLIGSICISIFFLYNFSSYWIYEFQNTRLEKQYVVNQPILKEIEQNQGKINDRNALLKRLSASTLRQSKIAWLLDQISILRPEDIVFKSCIFQPTEEELKKWASEKKNVDLMIIGTANKSSSIADYSLALEQAGFLKKIEVNRSSYNYHKTEFQFTFLIEL